MKFRKCIFIVFDYISVLRIGIERILVEGDLIGRRTIEMIERDEIIPN